MKKVFISLLGNRTRTVHLTVVILLALTLVVCIFSFTKPVTTTIEENANLTQLETTYHYEATITPNVLYPAGGTIPAGESIIKKITTAIPVTMNTKFISDKEVSIQGTHQVEMTLIAEDLWEKKFPLEEQQSFDLHGSDIGIIDGQYVIDLVKLNNFLFQVEEETGISPSKYTLEVQPNIVGTMSYGGQQMPIEVTDKLVFQYAFDSIVLMSEKEFANSLAFGTSELTNNTISLFGMTLPVGSVRMASSVSALLMFIAVVLLNKGLIHKKRNRKPNEMDRIQKKYGKRIIQVAKLENREDASIITLTAFESVLAIADEKELPIFMHELPKDNRTIYFLVDGISCYRYELEIAAKETSPVEEWAEGAEIYAQD